MNNNDNLYIAIANLVEYWDSGKHNVIKDENGDVYELFICESLKEYTRGCICGDGRCLEAVPTCPTGYRCIVKKKGRDGWEFVRWFNRIGYCSDEVGHCVA